MLHTSHKGTAVESFDELVPKYRANIRSGPLYDTGDNTTGTQLIGMGKKLKHDAFETGMQHVSQNLADSQYLHRMGQSQWLEIASQAEPQPVQLCSYTLAHKRGDELMWSEAHKESKSRYGPSFCEFVGLKSPSHRDAFQGLLHS